MFAKGPHISIDAKSLVPRILRIAEKELESWPESVQNLAQEIAAELFLVRYNPFITPALVKKSVFERFEAFRNSLDLHFVTTISEGITMFWSAHEADMEFKEKIIRQLSTILPRDSIDTTKYSLVDCATDATDLRMELPLLVVTPANAEQIRQIVLLADEMQFALVPRGGGSGATGGAVPARKRSVVLSLVRLNQVLHVDVEEMILTAQAGIITNDAVLAAAESDLLFSVDPASKAASSIGGNIAENAGGPLCFEYGTTIDNLLSYRMVTPAGKLHMIARQHHPRRAIAPGDTAVFNIYDVSGQSPEFVRAVSLQGHVLRKPGLGKDVTNKALGGLPGLQKEGTDGVIVDASFVLHKKLKHFRVMVLEFFGRTMDKCMKVVTDIVALRDAIRRSGGLVKVAALEEFNIKYVQAINYQKKSKCYEGDPISVLIVQLDGDDESALEEAAAEVVAICAAYDGVDVFVAKDAKQAELFWEDRHKLSMIAKRTSGFKMNEDVVIPIPAIPEFSLFLEELNLECTAKAYQEALKAICGLNSLGEDDRIHQEEQFVRSVIKKTVLSSELSDEELLLRANLFINSLLEDNPGLRGAISEAQNRMMRTRVGIASHMHAGDGNWHVNIPVNSNDRQMLAQAEKAALKVLRKAQELGGEVSGEHGIGITKIAFLGEEKIRAFNQYKTAVDPKKIFNPGKLTQKELPVAPFTFSFNSLIRDFRSSGLPDKERLIALLTDIQICTRCGKCKQFCPMYTPEHSLTFHPRNKNIILGALIEAIYYAQVTTGKIETDLLEELRQLMEYCTGCGKCMTVCPIKIPSQEVAMKLREYLEDKRAGGHPRKMRLIAFLAKAPAQRIPQFGKIASAGQLFLNKMAVVSAHRPFNKFFSNPMLSGKALRPSFKNIMDTLHLQQGSLFAPAGKKVKGTVLYFPGCGGAVLFKNTGTAGIALILQAGYAVAVPKEHLCCGYPMLAAGAQEAFATNQNNNVETLRSLAEECAGKGYPFNYILTGCGSCQEGLERHFLPEVFANVCKIQAVLGDIGCFLFEHCASVEDLRQGGLGPAAHERTAFKRFLYHSPCHAEDGRLQKTKAGKIYLEKLERFMDASAFLSSGCCGESGLGAVTSPLLYNKLREKKSRLMGKDLLPLEKDDPVVTSCPSCKIGLSRILFAQRSKRKVFHVTEMMAEVVFGKKWRGGLQKLLKHAALNQEGVRLVDFTSIGCYAGLEDDEADNGDE